VASFLVAPPDVYSLMRAGNVLAAAAAAWGGRYEEPERSPPCGRVDGRAEGVEVIVRVIAPQLTNGLRTYVRAYTGEPRGGIVTLRRRSWPSRLAGAFGRSPRSGDAALDRAFVMREGREGTLESFLGERLRGALRALMDLGTVDTLRYRHGAVELLIQGLGIELPSLDAAFEVAVAAGSWHPEGSVYRR
jgi:hypothetical protein